MTRICNLGSVNVDHVYRVSRLARPGETIASEAYERFAGGKGFNQSLALARAGARVRHAGRIGEDGAWLRAMLEEAGVDVHELRAVDESTGHALIQVAHDGENVIVLHGGANRRLQARDAEAALAPMRPGDWLLTQNETSAVADFLEAAARAGLRTALNPAPMNANVLSYPLEGLDLLCVNASEARGLSGRSDPQETLDALRAKCPKAILLLTLGADGAHCLAPGGEHLFRPAETVETVDATAAGDVFVGYFLAGLAAEAPLERCLDDATRAAAWCVARRGAAPSIPRREDLDAAPPKQ